MQRARRCCCTPCDSATLPGPTPTHAVPAATARSCLTPGKVLLSPVPLFPFLAFICLFGSGQRLLSVTSLTVP